MKLEALQPTASLSTLREHAIRNAPAIQPHAHHNMVSVRTAEYRGHHIVIETTYQISVDGVTLNANLHVGNDGRVHYHAIPNLDFASAVDLVEQLINAFPEDFPLPPIGHGTPSGGHAHSMSAMSHEDSHN